MPTTETVQQVDTDVDGRVAAPPTSGTPTAGTLARPTSAAVSPVIRLRSVARRAAAFATTHRASLAVVAVLLAVSGTVHGVGMDRSPAAFDDEGTYIAQAWAVLRRGELAHYTYWYDHPPAGWLQMAAYFGLTDAFDRLPYSMQAGREFMLLVHLASCCLVWLLARRCGLRRGTAALAVVLFSLSPLAVDYQRMVFLDNLAVLWILAALVFAASPRRGVGAAAAAGLCMTMAVTSKETALVLLPAVVWMLWRTADRRTRRFNLLVFTVLFVLTSAFYPLYALVKHEFLPGEGHVSLVWSIQWQLFSRADSGTVLDPDSGARGLVMSWLSQDPWVLTAGCLLTPVALLVPRLRPVALAMAIQVVLMLRGGYLPMPYVIGLLPFAALVIAGVADVAWSHRDAMTGRLAILRHASRAVLVAALAAVLVFVGPGWAQADRRHMTDRRVYLSQAVDWVDQNVPRGRRILVDDTLWVDLADRGFDPDRLEVIWSFKVDLDPAVRDRLTNGWRDLDYLVLKDVGDLSTLPIQRAAVENSTIVATFGTGQDAMTIRKVANGRP
jgi:4-amino-4-deoxy-L-arabinose transferase-like glycosyltransferase